MLSHYELYKIAGILHFRYTPLLLMKTFSYGNANKSPRCLNWKYYLHPTTRTYLTGALRKQNRKGFIIDLDNAKRATDLSGRRTRNRNLDFYGSGLDERYWNGLPEKGSLFLSYLFSFGLPQSPQVVNLTQKPSFRLSFGMRDFSGSYPNGRNRTS